MRYMTLAVLLFSQEPAFAQDGTGFNSEVGTGWTGGRTGWTGGGTGWVDLGIPYSADVRALGGAPIRTAPPDGFLAGPGPQFGTTLEGGEYAVTGVTRVPRLFDTDVWIEVTPRAADGGLIAEKSGWAYWGKQTDGRSSNFAIEAPEQQ